MRKRAFFLLMLYLVATSACRGFGSSSESLRIVLTDYDFDEFPASYFGYFPRDVQAHPGDTLEFQQAWTGEPHTVTFGTATRPLGTALAPYLRGGNPAAIDEDVLRLPQGRLPSVFNEDNSINQTAAAPCFVDDGEIPSDGKRCAARPQPAFDGKQVFFNSGYIPYEGHNGNTFQMKLAGDIAPGEYYYYCLLHGPTMGGYVDVVPKATKIPAQPAINRAARREVDRATDVLRAARNQARQLAGSEGDIVAGAFSLAVSGGDKLPLATVNAFLPATTRASVGQKVTWVLPEGPGHTVSFKVPSYLPAVLIANDGTVKLDPKANKPQGGPGYSEDKAPEQGFLDVDVGAYDGSFFLSSGYNDGPMRYSISFSKPGTYDYACLLHPRMVGKVIVTG